MIPCRTFNSWFSSPHGLCEHRIVHLSYEEKSTFVIAPYSYTLSLEWWNVTLNQTKVTPSCLFLLMICFVYGCTRLTNKCRLCWCACLAIWVRVLQMSFTQPQAQKEIHAGVFHQLMSPCHGTVGVFFFSLFFFFSFSSPMLSTRRQCEKKKGIVEWHESERERAKEVFFLFEHGHGW